MFDTIAHLEDIYEEATAIHNQFPLAIKKGGVG